MPIDNLTAYRMRQDGHAVIVICGECGDRVWTTDANYLHGADEWFCGDCVDEVVKDLIEEWADG